MFNINNGVWMTSKSNPFSTNFSYQFSWFCACVCVFMFMYTFVFILYVPYDWNSYKNIRTYGKLLVYRVLKMLRFLRTNKTIFQTKFSLFHIDVLIDKYANLNIRLKDWNLIVFKNRFLFHNKIKLD